MTSLGAIQDHALAREQVLPVSATALGRELRNALIQASNAGALRSSPAEILLVQAREFSTADWALLDRRRSSIAHRGLLIFLTTPVSFDELMRCAPNLASWLGGQVFAYPDDEPQLAAHRERRLAALRAWASRSDADVVAAARAGTLPPDPEYAEWLVLLGHGELLDPTP